MKATLTNRLLVRRGSSMQTARQIHVQRKRWPRQNIQKLQPEMRAADQLGIHAVEGLAINETARSFYQQYGFQSLRHEQRHLYLPISAVRKLRLH
ncbi:MAG: hypothetical protein ACLFSC_04885 [Wenzhouxiangella sp.]